MERNRIYFLVKGFMSFIKAHIRCTIVNEIFQVLFNLTDQATIEGLRAKIHYNTTSDDVQYYGADYDLDDHGTNNVVVVDADGNAVCATSTQNTLYVQATGHIKKIENLAFTSQLWKWVCARKTLKRLENSSVKRDPRPILSTYPESKMCPLRFIKNE